MFKVLSSEKEKEFRRDAIVRLVDNELTKHQFSFKNMTPQVFQANITGGTKPWVNILGSTLLLTATYSIYRDVKIFNYDAQLRGHIKDMFYKLFLEKIIAQATKWQRQGLYVFTKDEALIDVMMDYNFSVIKNTGSDPCKYKGRYHINSNV